MIKIENKDLETDTKTIEMLTLYTIATVYGLTIITDQVWGQHG